MLDTDRRVGHDLTAVLLSVFDRLRVSQRTAGVWVSGCLRLWASGQGGACFRPQRRPCPVLVGRHFRSVSPSGPAVREKL